MSFRLGYDQRSLQMKEKEVLQVLGESFFNSVLMDIEENTYTRMNFAPWLLEIGQTGTYTGLADFIVSNCAAEEYQENLKKDLSLENLKTFFNSRDPQERNEEHSITYETEVDGKRKWYSVVEIPASWKEDGHT